MSVVTRFPPSPTGFMHIGNARTALFNWLYARHCNGKFLLRIEDTDRDRHSDEAVQAIIDGMKWLGLDWDNQDIIFQSKNKKRHISVAKQLVKEGKAYYCYCSPEELDEMRKQARAEGRSSFYDRRWRDRDPSEAPKGVKPVIRIKAPLHGNAVLRDLVQGYVKMDNRNIDDFIIMRSDDTPTYMLAVVVDDHDMEVSHIIRGDDHLNNAFRQNILYEALDWKIPEYAHVPLIHGTDGTKFSKRHGAQQLEEYHELGYLPEAMRNYLLRLGWSHGNDEIIPTDKAIEWFSLSGLGKSAARFDQQKLENLNTHYIRHKDDKELIELIGPIFKDRRGLEVTKDNRKYLEKGLSGLKQRAKTLIQLVDEGAFYLREVPFVYDEHAQEILNEQAIQILKELVVVFEGIRSFEDESIEKKCRDVAANYGNGKLGNVGMPLRAALTGTNVSPPIFKAAEVLGKEESIKRLNAAIEVGPFVKKQKKKTKEATNG